MNRLNITFDFDSAFKKFLEKQGEDIIRSIRDDFSENVSSAGEPPSKQTGKLSDSLNYEVEGDIVGVGADVDYALALEMGTANMAPRPFLRPALYKIKIGQIL